MGWELMMALMVAAIGCIGLCMTDSRAMSTLYAVLALSGVTAVPMLAVMLP